MNKLSFVATQKGYDKKALSEGTGIPKSTIEKYWYNVTQPSGYRLNILVNFLGIEIGELLDV